MCAHLIFFVKIRKYLSKMFTKKAQARTCVMVQERSVLISTGCLRDIHDNRFHRQIAVQHHREASQTFSQHLVREAPVLSELAICGHHVCTRVRTFLHTFVGHTLRTLFFLFSRLRSASTRLYPNAIWLRYCVAQARGGRQKGEE